MCIFVFLYLSPKDIVEINVPLDTLYVISETILQVRWPNQQYHSTEEDYGMCDVHNIGYKSYDHKTKCTMLIIIIIIIIIISHLSIDDL